jgi:hypothetical protein
VLKKKKGKGETKKRKWKTERIYFFLQKDLHISKKGCIFALDLGRCQAQLCVSI